MMGIPAFARLPALLAVAAALALPAALPAPAVDAAAIRELDGYVAAAVRQWNVPGLAIAVVAGDSVVFSRGYGVREVDRPEPVDTGTRFAIGSTTKAMVATALGILVDEGKVAWDEPVITYLPWFRVGDPYITREMTVRDLLTHRAGFPNIDQIWSNPGFSGEEIVRRIATLQPVYSFRSSYIYQNVMYAVAGEVIAAASGMPWDEFVRTRILLPLGMNATEPTLARLAGQQNVASPHTAAGGTIRVTRNRSVDAVGPAGSIWSSVDDMATWMRFNLNGGQLDGRRLLREETQAEIFSPQVIAPRSMYPTMTLVRPRFFTYGLAWFLHDYRGEAVAMHTGSINGMNALVGLLPDRNVGVFVLINTGGAELRHALMYRVFDMYLGRPPRDWSSDLMALYRPPATQAAQAPAVAGRGVEATGAPPSLPLERYAGEYRDPIFGRVVVSVRGGALYLTSELERRGPLAHRQYDTFQAAWEDEPGSSAAVVFLADGSGGIRGLRVFGRVFER
jgi:CubicO group peptidase (beta-lactamase class C family)